MQHNNIKKDVKIKKLKQEILLSERTVPKSN